jgi:uroporphyrinogen-III synthase
LNSSNIAISAQNILFLQVYYPKSSLYLQLESGIHIISFQFVMHPKIPVILLKTKSTPVDRYQEHFESLGHGMYSPIFIPVLQHQMINSSLREISDLISTGAFHSSITRKYGGIIFTSQRAVEAFTHITKQLDNVNKLIDEKTVLYVVGPATARAVAALGLQCPLLGEETGNGDALAAFILDDYNARWSNSQLKPSLLFLVGEQRRDIIPRTLQADTLTAEQRISVNEIEVYKTAEHPDFEESFRQEWSKGEKGEQWVVVFSPSGCRTVLQVMQLIDENTGKYNPASQTPTKIATIGPTTKSFLRQEFDFDPHSCAPNPTPEGLADAIHSCRGQNQD